MLCSSPSPRPRAELPPDDFMCDDIDSYLIAMETSDLTGPSYEPQPQTSSANRKSQPLSEEENEDEEAEEQSVLGPPNKKVLNPVLYFNKLYISDQQFVHRIFILSSLVLLAFLRLRAAGFDSDEQPDDAGSAGQRQRGRGTVGLNVTAESEMNNLHAQTAKWKILKKLNQL